MKVVLRSIWLRALVLLVPLAVAAALVGGCRDDEVTEPRAPLVALGMVVGETVEDRIVATGELRAKQEAELAAEVDGPVTAVLAEEGVAVDAGQPLLLIDPERRELELESARASLAQAQAALREAGRDLERAEKLHGRGAVSDARLDDATTARTQADSQVRAARARLGVAERALRDATVVAPFAGWLAARHVSRGEYVRPGSPLFDIVALDPIEVEFHLAERDSSRVALGMSVDVTVAPYPDEDFRGRVTFVAPTIERRTRTLRVKAELENADRRLRPGLFAHVDLGIARREGIAMVPEEAVLQRADGQVVFRLGPENRVERRVVRVGIHRDGWVEVTEGLDVDDAVVTRGHVALVDGAPVRIAEGAPDVPPVAGAPRAEDGS